MITIDQIKVLNLARRQDRRQHIQKEFVNSNLLRNSYRFYKSIDGQKLSYDPSMKTLLTPHAFDLLYADDDKKQYGVDYTLGSYAILLTYMKIFNELIDCNQTALLFEDDICLEPNFDYTLTKILTELPEDFDICYLGYCPGENLELKKYSECLSIPSGQLTCNYGFVISPTGSKKVLDLKPFTYQIDTEIYLNFSRINVFCSTSPIVKCKHEFSSDAQI